jgi:hypothetical protein
MATEEAKAAPTEPKNIPISTARSPNSYFNIAKRSVSSCAKLMSSMMNDIQLRYPLHSTQSIRGSGPRQELKSWGWKHKYANATATSGAKVMPPVHRS